ncbi:Rpn family recombination-promoting nuclease/putative transposase [Dactylococcopsis salina]|uniref:DUF4351 domain-containing protein n=1 Tax=Dactylococcopsis salina (strain PCC 8305) TaxID=13035 RepID=K9YWU5_DACS8|nr:Rpn family recombination-promoting nuclease/putative transposase [Dactylococcopsis salina]AFZ50583.1 hypothetical protein Dacsa_1930 [Dactylococcopsis salina PCC 8305]
MKTDSLFYKLFQNVPELFFELIQETNPSSYQFDSVEVKQTSFRCDGVFLPDENTAETPIYFVEVQWQKDETLYGRLFSEIFLYLRHHPEQQFWRAVLIYPQRSSEGTIDPAYEVLINSEQVKRIYLEDLAKTQTNSWGLKIFKLMIESESKAAQEAQEILREIKQETFPVSSASIEELVETIIVYKFPQLSRKEIAKMLGLADSITQTRVYQEGLQEGEYKLIKLIIKQLQHRFGELSAEEKAKIEQLSSSELESLGEALLDFTARSNLTQWLKQ